MPLFDEIHAFLLEQFRLKTKEDRISTIEGIFSDSDMPTGIIYDGNADNFTTHLIHTLHRRDVQHVITLIQGMAKNTGPAQQTKANAYIERIKAGELPPPPPEIGTFPPPVDKQCPTAPLPPQHFTGREPQFTELRDKLAASDTVAVTAVQGMGGIGKTSFMQAFCHRDDAPFDVVLWADITQTPNAAAHLAAWGRITQENYQLPLDQPLEVVAGSIRSALTTHFKANCGPRCLVVLDDVWENGTQAVALLQKAVPEGAKIVLTTRHNDVARTAKASLMQLHELTDAESFDMLQKWREKTYISDDHLRELVSIAKGHPLTLEIAIAALNEADDNQHVADILADYRKGLADGTPFDALATFTDAPQALTVVFERSYTTLTAAEQRAFKLLGVMALDVQWWRDLVGEVWGMAGDDQAKTVRDLHVALRQRAFIRQVDIENAPPDAPAIYEQHPLLRSYARALIDDADYDAAFYRYVRLMTGVGQQFEQLPQEEWVTLSGFVPHMLYVGDTLLPMTQAAPDNTDLQTLAGEFSAWTMKYLNYRPADLFTGEGEQRQPTRIQWFEMGLRVWQRDKNQARQATTLNNIGLVWDALGEKHKALAYYEQALPLYEAVGDRRGQATTLTNMGSAWYALGEGRKAIDYFEKALPVFEAVGDRGGQATTLNNIAAIHFHNSEYNEAIAIFEQVIGIMQAIGDVSSEALFHVNIAVVVQRLDRIDEAITHIEQGRALLQKYNLPQNAAGYKLVDYDALLAQLRGETPSEEEQAAQIMQQLAAVYQSGGADAVRQMLRGQAPDAVIDAIIAQLANMPAQPPPSQATLPAETVQMLAGNTVAVMTTHPDQRDEWRDQLQGIRAQFASRGDDWAHEVAFADALLTILAGRSVSLLRDNPYAGVVGQVVAAINAEG